MVFCATVTRKTHEIAEQGKHWKLCRIPRTASDDCGTLLVPNHESLEDMQKRCENLLARIHKESEANLELSKARAGAEETSRKMVPVTIVSAQVNHQTEELNKLVRQRLNAEEQLEDAPVEMESKTALPEYYNRVFGELKQGEILEWYNIDWQDLKPLLESFFQSRPRRILDVGCGILASQIGQLGCGRLHTKIYL
eukprot:s1018_g16.t1